MIAAIPFEPARFRSAAAHYLQGRSDYAPALIQNVATLCGLDGAGRLLDLGCGPGQLAMAFRPYFASALGMDPEPEMLALAAARSESAGLDIAFRHGAAHDLTPDMGPFRLVTIGRAFHWMDRPVTARTLDGLIEPGGALVLLQVNALDVPDNAWRTEYQAVLDAALGDGQRSAWRKPGWVRHEAVLLDSPFSDLHRVGVIERHRVAPADLVHRARSMSMTTRARLGDDEANRLSDAVRTLAEAAAQDGWVTEVIESIALIARRP
jgi:trans-aconitate methyltransferase